MSGPLPSRPPVPLPASSPELELEPHPAATPKAPIKSTAAIRPSHRRIAVSSTVMLMFNFTVHRDRRE
jgi:hypothetical protein